MSKSRDDQFESTYVLVVEDEEDLADLLRFNLERDGFVVRVAETGEQAIQIITERPPDLVLLDLMLPRMDGLEVCRRVKGELGLAAVPLIMVTAKGEDADVVSGLELGADDYITKPFSPRVLLARIRAVLRRKQHEQAREAQTEARAMECEGLVVQPDRHEVSLNGEPIELTATEFRLLMLLMRRPGRVFTRQQIIELIHGGHSAVTDRSVDVQVVSLRRKLGQDADLIQTVRGVGYRFPGTGMIPLVVGSVGLWQGLAIALAVGLGILVLLHRRTQRRLFHLRQSIDRITAGQVDLRLPYYDGGEIGGLSRSLDRMAGEFNQRLRSLRQQRNELEAVLSSMVEGVLAVDSDERIVSINLAAANLLRLDPATAVGRSIQEGVRNISIQQFVAEAVSLDSPAQADLVLRVDSDDPDEAGERFLQAQSAALRDAAGHRIGALIVLHDVTRLRRLEVLRREFVANVSHEIKTPITAIKGAVETVLDSLEPGANEDVERFLKIVVRQADRLNAIVEDLLSLARIEQDSERDRIVLEPTRMIEMLTAAATTCSLQADARQIEIATSCDEQLTAEVNSALLEQAVVNLLDNAIKYSPQGTTVRLVGRRDENGLAIEVIDEGAGIEAEHLPRLFERFYRTDKARSRAQGGTGLGLAIVKHIVNAHHGRVTVDSHVGRGSTFRIHLPG